MELEIPKLCTLGLEDLENAAVDSGPHPRSGLRLLEGEWADARNVPRSKRDHPDGDRLRGHRRDGVRELCSALGSRHGAVANSGFGVKVFITKHLALRPEVRAYLGGPVVFMGKPSGWQAGATMGLGYDW